MTAKLIPFRRPDGAAEPSDVDLVAAIARGDRDALGALYDRHHALVWRFVARALGPQGPEVDDIVQSTFVEVWRSAPRFAARSEVRTWILGIAHNLARRHYRDHTRRHAALTVLADNTAEPATPEPRMHDRLLLERLQGALQNLSPELRSAFVLCDLEDVRGVDAARVLGVRPGTLWRRLHDARKRLRQALDGGAR